MKKTFKLTNQSVEGFGNKNGFSIVSVSIEDNKLELTEHKGMGLTLGGLLACLKYFPREIKIAEQKAKSLVKQGCNPFANTGMSGRKTLLLHTLEHIIGEIYNRHTKYIMDISCFSKISGYNEYIPLAELLLFLPEFQTDLNQDYIKIVELKEFDTTAYKKELSSEHIEAIEKLAGNYTFTYIDGKHVPDQNGDTFTWELPAEIKAEIGDLVEVETCYGSRVVKIMNMFTSTDYHEHKKVISNVTLKIKKDQLREVIKSNTTLGCETMEQVHAVIAILQELKVAEKYYHIVERGDLTHISRMAGASKFAVCISFENSYPCNDNVKFSDLGL